MHPFYLKWIESKLTLDELREYSRQYYFFVENFTMFVIAVLQAAESSVLLYRKMLDSFQA